MKYLSDYVEEAQAKAFDEAGAFFAFGQSRFEEKKQDGIEYTNLGMGLICPVENAKRLMRRISEIHAEGIAADLAENGRDRVILRELNNYECFYTGDTQPAEDVLADYGITIEEVRRVFRAPKTVTA